MCFQRIYRWKKGSELPFIWTCPTQSTLPRIAIVCFFMALPFEETAMALRHAHVSHARWRRGCKLPIVLWVWRLSKVDDNISQTASLHALCYDLLSLSAKWQAFPALRYMYPINDGRCLTKANLLNVICLGLEWHCWNTAVERQCTFLRKLQSEGNTKQHQFVAVIAAAMLLLSQPTLDHCLTDVCRKIPSYCYDWWSFCLLAEASIEGEAYMDLLRGFEYLV